MDMEEVFEKCESCFWYLTFMCKGAKNANEYCGIAEQLEPDSREFNKLSALYEAELEKTRKAFKEKYFKKGNKFK